MLRGDFVDMAEFIICWSVRVLLIGRKKFRDGAHEIGAMKVVAIKVIFEFIKTVLERQFIEYVFVL